MDQATRQQSSFVYNVPAHDLLSIELKDPERTYFPGDRISGTVHVGLKFMTLGHSSSRVAVHLACKVRLAKASFPLFKIPLEPVPLSRGCRVPFHITVPDNIPSTIDHEHVPGKLVYKIQAIHEIQDLPSCVWPKASVPVKIHERISTMEEKYNQGLTSEGQRSFSIRHDIVLKHCTLRKGQIETASAWVHIPRSCYLPDDVIPFTLNVKHFVPSRQNDGITAYLERITTQRVTTADSGHHQGHAIDTQSIAQITLPLSCDGDEFTSQFTCNALRVPADTPPTLDKEQYPLQVAYRIRVVVNLDIDGLPLRKRDRMANYVGKVKMRFSEDDNTCSSLNTANVVLDLPIRVGTTREELSLPPTPQPSLLDAGYGFFKQDIHSPPTGPPPDYNSIKYHSQNPTIVMRPLSCETQRSAPSGCEPNADYLLTTSPSRFSAPPMWNGDQKPPLLYDIPPAPVYDTQFSRPPSAPQLQDIDDRQSLFHNRSWSASFQPYPPYDTPRNYSFASLPPSVPQRQHY